MKINISLKPYAKLFGEGTKKVGLLALYRNYGITATPNVFGTYGAYHSLNGKDAYFYTIQVYKRGKYRKRKHYAINIYKVSTDFLRVTQLYMKQERNGIRIKQRS